MVHLLAMLLALTAGWFALSPSVSPLNLAFAAISVLATAWMTARLEIVDRDSAPWARTPQLLGYFARLVLDIAKGAWNVLVAALGPRSRLSPAVGEATMSGTSDFSRALFANSVTLTPGTVTLSTLGDRAWVHALRAPDVEAGAMTDLDARAARAGDPKVGASAQAASTADATMDESGEG